MATLMRYDPFREVVSLRNAMDQLFENSFVQPSWRGGSQGMMVPIDVVETEQGYQLRALLPGVKAEDIEMSVQQNTLTLKGKVHPWFQENKQANWLLQEIGSGSFERSITFSKPIDADKIETSYEHGVLTALLPVHEASRPRKINILGGKSEPVTVEAGKH